MSLNVSFTTTPDYSNLNPPKAIKINRVFNTILIPKESVYNPFQPSDIVSLSYNNKIIKHKVGLDSGYIKFYDKEYHFFHLVPGLKPNSFMDNYEIILENESLKLNTSFDATHSAKLINGLLILPNNFNYLFNHTKYSIVFTNNKNIFTTITKQQNKYNYYSANTHNTILSILHDKNTNTLYELNNSHFDSTIRPLYTANYPLGNCSIETKGVNNTRMLFNNQLFDLKDKISINYLPSGKYKVSFLDSSNNTITIDSINNTYWNQNFFEINIDSLKQSLKTESSLLVNNKYNKPNKNYSNLTINLYPYKTSFELFGPNNFYKKFITGYQQLFNIFPGIYTIKYKTYTKEILIIKNDNNYFSNL